MSDGKKTPVAIFVFKRPQHTARMLEALARNPELAELPLFIFCDGARREDEKAAVEATRSIVRDFAHPAKTVVERETNSGLAASIIEAVSNLCSNHGRVIVLEDDLVVSNGFLGFMLKALDRYENDPQVMQVSGHAFPVESFGDTDPVLFLPFISSWGWATWDRAWSAFDTKAEGWQALLLDRALARSFDIGGVYPYSAMLAAQMEGRIDSWAIRWNWSVFRSQGCVVYPPVSLVTNVGFDGSGTHRSANAKFEAQSVADAATITFLDPPSAPDREDERFRLVQASVKAMQGNPLKQFAKRLLWLYVRRRILKSPVRGN
ncbi:glycosyltransferase [Rhizobium grahamii]|uniref:Glycosyltransferase n=1 Tax=Rhizobium grahamii TaxID=1120045 RepID=A0A5Q0CDK6_9HYPH|nr:MULTISPECIES: glycosyltransferase [Rhizobium]QFY62017.1 glycosyltransferase [Rhizobium grahamii]QRM48806.1 glycosyltransferase [Rhizobium sp. BG6]